ncbi:Fe-only nitrogenase accessory protein AnfO [Methanomicrobium sp. W14]|uniref:Fe-only nitrogenase accessory AnfO family protein n=1 Tax=Methanomicrobium sp. W14 TaxID=2817839 RepID=UPI001AE775E1|nr:Fe-only nitrogenase accessory AnfO family protein [Methanomicrobium sp. W14]MBP2132598.1 Fe-only nitrogenase accessory protein AnfO [Methanomicrobium sp. W14]
MSTDASGKKRDIAVILDTDGETGRLSDPGTIVVYSKNGYSWEVARETEFSIDKSQGLPELRQKMLELKDFLADCRIFAAKSASGAMFFELEKSGFNIWEVSGRPAEFLDSIVEQEIAEDRAEKPEPLEIPVPLEVSPKNYYISIKEIQGKVPDLSSKMILQDFINRKKFESLEIACDHVPPWIELDARRIGLMMETEKKAPCEYLVRLAPDS